MSQRRSLSVLTLLVGVILFTSSLFAQETPTNFMANLDPATGEVLLSWDAMEGATSYHVFAGTDEIAAPDVNYYVDRLDASTTVTYTVTAEYDAGTSAPTTGEEIIWDGVLGSPIFDYVGLNSSTGQVYINWFGVGGDEKISYEDGGSTSGYSWVGHTMSMHITPDGPCRILQIEFDVFMNDTVDTDFDAEIYLWDHENNHPSDDQIFTRNVEAFSSGNVVVDLSAEDLIVDTDFTVGFGSLNENVRVYFDSTGSVQDRSWDSGTNGWDPWTEPYYIRAVVQYLDGGVDVLGAAPAQGNSVNELDDFEGYTLYRNDEEVLSQVENHSTHFLTEYGEQSYTVSATFAGVEGPQSEPFTFTWDAPLIDPTNLAYELDEETGEVSLTWEHPELEDVVGLNRHSGYNVAVNEVLPSGKVSSRIAEQQVDELDDFIEFDINRNGTIIGTTTTVPYVDQLPENGQYAYIVRAIYDEGISGNSNPVVVNYTTSNVENPKSAGVPEKFAIESAYPNPFNPSVNVVLAVNEAVKVNAVVYDVLGREIATLSNGILNQGYHTFTWNAAQNAAGIYFLQVKTAAGFSDMKKLMLVK